MTEPKRRRPPLDQLRTFLVVYRAGSFSDAARRLNVSQPTVTNHVASLEKWFGNELFIRDITGVTPTVHAQQIAGMIADQIDYIDRFFGNEESVESALREVRIGGPRELILTVVIPALAADAGRLPKLNFAMAPSRDLLDDLRAGRLDLAVSTIRPRDPELVGWPLIDEGFWMVAPPSLKIPGDSISRLSTLPIVAYNRDLAVIRRFWNSVFNAEPAFDPDLVVADLLAVKQAVLDGFGMSVLPSYLVYEEVASGALVRVAETAEPPINTVFLVAQRPAFASRSMIEGMAKLLLKRVNEFGSRIDPSTSGS
ncbi:MAG: LysR family transcriptional regulator [Gordonia sp. (in: high G+C Gram-positive bacteria)]|uniref:LysR family transcriptional regulator n=1 Tax=Gordonia sp. (in: high G+C Gram-positive bacteria) TaxID=84139 RepID=UPI003BB58471